MLTMTNLVNYLVLQVSRIPDNGLYHGRMGIILALYCYGLVNGEKRICNYANDILQHSAGNYYNEAIGLEKGLAGLGLGFSLLYKAGMFKDDLNDLLFEIDNKIMSIDPRRMTDFSFRNGAAGVLYYIRTRQSIDQECLSLHKDYIRELEANIQKNKDCIELNETLFTNIRQPVWKETDFLDKEPGIDNGIAYFLIQESYDKVFLC